MSIDPSKISDEAFLLYAELYLPEEAKRQDTLNALALCAAGTERETPGVATYLFRPSPLATLTGQQVRPGCVAVESTELYLTYDAFRRHATTPEFRAGVDRLFHGIDRMGIRVFWIGKRPPAEILRQIHHSDPQARPAGVITKKLFDVGVYSGANPEDIVMISVLCPLARGLGARATELVDSFDDGIDTVSLVAFFHPYAQHILRFFAVLPLRDPRAAEELAERLQAFNEVVADGSEVLVLAQTARQSPQLREQLQRIFERTGPGWTVSCEEYSGYICHAHVNTDAGESAVVAPAAV